MSTTAILQAFARLKHAQQIQLVEDMWDRIAQSDEPTPLSTVQKKELRRRKAARAGTQPQGSSWTDVKKRLLSTNGG